MEIHSRKSSEDYCWVLGLRNSHDKTFPAGIVAGASVFVCDNLSFLGEVNFSRQHTVPRVSGHKSNNIIWLQSCDTKELKLGSASSSWRGIFSKG
jgi:hypothetical protein